jgi:hypothetical protein
LFERDLTFSKCEKTCIDLLRSLKTGVLQAADGLSRPNGIFVGLEERKNAYLEACGLLVRLEAPIAALQESIAQLIANAGTSASHFLQCDRWRTLYEHAVTAFLCCVEDAADFEHEGREAEPAKLYTACNDFCKLAEDFLKKYSDERR